MRRSIENAEHIGRSQFSLTMSMQLTNASQVCLHLELANSIAMNNVVVARNLTVGPLLLNGKLYMFEQLVRSIRQLTAMALEQLPALTLLENSGMKTTRRLGRGVLEPLDPKEFARKLRFHFPFSFFLFPYFSPLLLVDHLAFGKSRRFSRCIQFKKVTAQEVETICELFQSLPFAAAFY